MHFSVLDRRLGILYKRFFVGAITQRPVVALFAVAEPVLLVFFGGEWKRFQRDLVVLYSVGSIAERLKGIERQIRLVMRIVMKVSD